mmetsp:Transcript_11499/g.15521  ORF Transcript_11499/g.15521 Transcript_11499/m.15521 type:complete len:326 (+) Transcript_11499:1210-2187(+)|eukprot:CAMPEP_0185597576 /NCGR_PEP_ID=MMETSP0434-20130131/81448_1 /TAXON_ID=626734 ORGANISM="Favella taraikaensis, Strain Fe Narragansett Bay" /NCGR_SAMPLE_ID=MMETSP0434 /ASSEMBLY_ACC=CAM_ASM_000379 /LENGTH=325 /DNA_ID=CAMNT_0028226327 /DNA_START=1209 /DNA_END=2186 /DNA_ORIENTATION=+
MVGHVATRLATRHILQLLPGLDQVLFRELLVDFRLVQLSRQSGQFLILFFYQLLILDHLFAQLVELVILDAAVFQEDVQLLGLERIVFLEPDVVFLKGLNLHFERIVELLQARNLLVPHSKVVLASTSKLLQLDDSRFVALANFSEHSQLLVHLLDHFTVVHALACALLLVPALERINRSGEHNFLFPLLALESLQTHFKLALGLFDIAQGALCVPLDEKLDLCLHAKEEHFKLVLRDQIARQLVQLSDKLRVQELESGLSFVLTSFQQAQRLVLVLQLLAVSLQLAIDLVAVMELLLEHAKLVVRNDAVLLKLFMSELEGPLIL